MELDFKKLSWIQKHYRTVIIILFTVFTVSSFVEFVYYTLIFPEIYKGLFWGVIYIISFISVRSLK